MSPKSNCYSEEELIACLEGTLSESQQQAVETHVAACDACSRIADEIKEYLLRDCGSESEVDQARKPGWKRDVDTLDPAETVDYLGKLGGYDITRVLGRGGYGIVFEALDNALHRKVAIKVLTRDLAKRTVSRRRFIREARACASINHPNVVTIHSVEDAGDTPYIVMELIQGETLRERIRREPKLDLMDILRISSQLAQGLAAAHAQGIIHRDVKPGNIMLLDMLRVKIADFGLARVATENLELTSRGVAVGTPAYMSPEQVRGEELDGRSDLFAMGCVIYAMFTGHSPFHGRNPLEIAMRIESHRPPRLATFSQEVPEFLDSIVVRLLEKNREKRFQSAAEVARIFSEHLAILNQTPTDKFPIALRMSMFEPSGNKKSLRRPILSGVVALLVVVLCVGGWLYSRPAPPKVPLGLVSKSSPPIPLAKPKREVTVARTGDADFETIGEALQNVAAGGTVTIEDDAEYIETILLTEASRYAGVQINAPKHATIRSNAAGPVVKIVSIPGLRWHGLNIQAPQMQHGIEINGACAGLELTDLEIRRVPNPETSNVSLAGIVLRHGAAGKADEPLVIQGLRLRDTNVGIVVGNPDTAGDSPQHIIIEHCDVHGLSRNSSTLLALLRNMEDIAIRRNLFSNGQQGISVVATEQKMPLRCEITHNTWHDLRNWFGWTGPVEQSLSILAHHNLIVDSGQIAILPAGFLAAIQGLPPAFTGNAAVVASVAEGHSFAPLADLVDTFPLLSRDHNHPDYLKPDFEHLTKLDFLPGSVPGRYSGNSQE